MMTDLNDVWLQIIIDNGEDCKKALACKLEKLQEKADSLKSAVCVGKSVEQRMSAAAAFWTQFVEEEEPEGNKRMRRTTMDMQKAKSELLLLQGLVSAPSGSSKSTTCTTTDQDQDQDHSDCDVNVQALRAGGFIGGFSGKGGEPEEPEPIPEEHAVVATAAAADAI